MSDYQPSPPTNAPYSDTARPAASTPVLSILALIFGILGVLSSWFFVGGLPAIAGIVLGFIARRREPAAKGLWLTGIITGFAGLAILVAVIIGSIAFFAYAASHPGSLN